MSKRLKVFILILTFFLLTLYLSASEDITIQVRFFQGIWMGDHPGLKHIEFLSTPSYPKIFSIKDVISSPESELKAAVINALLDDMNLQSVDDLFSFNKTWTGMDKSLTQTIMQKPASAFRFMFSLKKYSSKAFSLKTNIYFKEIEISPSVGKDPDKELERELKSVLGSRRYEKTMDKVLEQEFEMEIDNPLIVGIPHEKRTFFLMIMLTRESPDSEIKAREEEKTQDQRILNAVLKPIHKVSPVYPEELRLQGIGGEIQLILLVDKDGNVQFVEVVESLHPYLDYSAVQALRQWKFEPGLQKGKPLPSAFMMTLKFNHEVSHREEKAVTEDKTTTDKKPFSQKQLRKVLEKCSEYCEKLAGSALDFICEEKIREIHYNFGIEQIDAVKKRIIERKIVYTKKSSMGLGVISVVKGASKIWDPYRTMKNQYVCDYQLIKIGDKIEERRIILKENGRLIKDQKKLLEKKNLSVLRPLFASIRLLAQDRQNLFNYKILKEEKVQNRKAYVLEVIPKFENEGGVENAKIWIDKKSFQILKTEIEGIPIEGYEDILREATQLNVKPEFKTTHVYRIAKKGVLFPSQSKVRVDYPGLGSLGGKLIRLKTDMTYEKHKFFIVETDHKVIKKISEDLFFQRSKNRQIFENLLQFSPCLLKF